MKDLPASSVDVILLALDDHEMLQQERTKPWHRAGIAWARSPGSGAAPPVVIAIDPLSPHQGFKPELSTKVNFFHNSLYKYKKRLFESLLVIIVKQ